MPQWMRWGALVLACSSYAVLNVPAWYPAVRYGVPDIFRAVFWELIRWNLWIPIGAALVRWARRPRTVWWCVVAAIGHTAILLLVYSPLLIHVMGHFLRYRWFVLMNDALTGIVVSGLILGVARLREQETRSAALEAQVAIAQLDALKMQLHPHFLFNTLNAIAALQLDDPETARRMTIRVAEFLRLAIENSGVHRVTLGNEMEFVSRYLEIERLRFPKKLTVTFAIAPDTLQAEVPNLILQPIIENAIRHGIATQTSPGQVEISSLRRNGHLILSVRDSGPGFRKTGLREGIGLANTRARLARMYGEHARLGIENGRGGGAVVELVLPLEKRA
jgi:two-component system LytT family sensor kinase